MSRIEQYIRDQVYDIPTLVLDIDQVAANYAAFTRGLPEDFSIWNGHTATSAHVHYAVKANPHPAILQRLVALGSRFDAASRQEIEMCIAAGAEPKDISFGNTIKRPQDIAWAWQQGVRLFAADSEAELDKIAANTENAKVFIRVLASSAEAEWPLSRKFGCSTSYVIPLLAYTKLRCLEPVGLSFHVGSQTRHPHMWYDCMDTVSAVWHDARSEGYDLWLLNVGGGFPAYYGKSITDPETYVRTIVDATRQRFPNVRYLMMEPGRGLVGNAGDIAAEVLLVSRKTDGDPVRWVYLSVGRFSGLAETEDESIKYQFVVPGKEHGDTGECVVAGPTCDSADVLYEKNLVQLPVDLAPGDRIIIKTCGAYTSTYSTVAFNGFPPLQVVALDQ